MTSLDPSEEIRIINDLTENGVSGMAVFPLDHPNVYALLNSLIEKGIAVITFNSPAPEVKVYALSDRIIIKAEEPQPD